MQPYRLSNRNSYRPARHICRSIPFHLSKFSYPISIVAVLWIAFISLAFCLPELNPVSTKTLSYAPVTVGIIPAYALGFWTLSARTWFTGPIKLIAGVPHSLCYMRWLCKC
jgi:hypothetical protein